VSETGLAGIKDAEARKALAEAVLAQLEAWQLHPANQAALLGLDDIAPFRKGEPLPLNDEVLERTSHLLAIGRALHRLLPYQPEKRSSWFAEKNDLLDGATPLQWMLMGLEQMRMLRRMLDAGSEGRGPAE
jgi:hypothetical protein